MQSERNQHAVGYGKKPRVGAIPADEIIAALNTLGNEGWEAVSVFLIEMALGATNMVGILLKRAVSG